MEHYFYKTKVSQLFLLKHYNYNSTCIYKQVIDCSSKEAFLNPKIPDCAIYMGPTQINVRHRKENHIIGAEIVPLLNGQ